jgi:hypothetical protein
MTTPEDRDLWERDEEALRTPAPVDPMRSEAARVARYAKDLLELLDAPPLSDVVLHEFAYGVARCASTLADDRLVQLRNLYDLVDAERAVAEAERDQLRETLVARAETAEAMAGRLGERVAYYRDSEVPSLRSNADGWAARAEAAESERDQLRHTVTRLNRRAQIAEAAIHELTHGTGQGKARAVAAEMWERCQSAHEQGCERAQVAEAKVAKVVTLADWFESQMNWNEWGIHRQIRAALADAPAEQVCTPCWFQNHKNCTGKAAKTSARCPCDCADAPAEQRADPPVPAPDRDDCWSQPESETCATHGGEWVYAEDGVTVLPRCEAAYLVAEGFDELQRSDDEAGEVLDWLDRSDPDCTCGHPVGHAGECS